MASWSLGLQVSHCRGLRHRRTSQSASGFTSLAIAQTNPTSSRAIATWIFWVSLPRCANAQYRLFKRVCARQLISFNRCGNFSKRGASSLLTFGGNL